MLTREQIDAIKLDIDLATKAAGPLVGTLAPGAIPWLIIGQVVAKQVPDVVAMIQSSLSGEEPTDEEKDAMAAQLAVLGNPDLP